MEGVRNVLNVSELNKCVRTVVHSAQSLEMHSVYTALVLELVQY